jgi:hypothetical protein
LLSAATTPALLSPLRLLSGVRDVVNRIKLKPHADSGNVAAHIRNALERHADIEAAQISRATRLGQVLDDVEDEITLSRP